MKIWIKTLAGLVVLVSALAGSGCAPMPYQDSYCTGTQVIIIREPVPVPYPVPVQVEGSYPAPQRHTPLTKQRDSGSPRIKTPRGDRSGDQPAGRPRVADRGPSKRPGLRR